MTRATTASPQKPSETKKAKIPNVQEAVSRLRNYKPPRASSETRKPASFPRHAPHGGPMRNVFRCVNFEVLETARIGTSQNLNRIYLKGKPQIKVTKSKPRQIMSPIRGEA